jgi:hypothetical protein
MFIGSRLGVSCSPSWVKVTRVVPGGGPLPSYSCYSAPLPVGCIDERSGRVEDSRRCVQALEVVPVLRPGRLHYCRISLALPRVCSYTISWRVEGLGRPLRFDEIRDRYACQLPGKQDALCIDIHQRLDPSSGDARVMLVAVRRDLLESYLRLLMHPRCHVVCVTTEEIARFNLAVQSDYGLYDQNILVARLDKEHAEISHWDQGILMGGCVVESQQAALGFGSESRLEQYPHPLRHTKEVKKPTAELVATVQGMLAEGVERGRRIDKVVVCGPAKADAETRQLLQAALAAECSMQWVEIPRYEDEVMPHGALSCGRDSESGWYDEAIGALVTERAHSQIDNRWPYSRRPLRRKRSRLIDPS